MQQKRGRSRSRSRRRSRSRSSSPLKKKSRTCPTCICHGEVPAGPTAGQLADLQEQLLQLRRQVTWLQGQLQPYAQPQAMMPRSSSIFQSCPGSHLHKVSQLDPGVDPVPLLVQHAPASEVADQVKTILGQDPHHQSLGFHFLCVPPILDPKSQGHAAGLHSGTLPLDPAKFSASSNLSACLDPNPSSSPLGPLPLDPVQAPPPAPQRATTIPGRGIGGGGGRPPCGVEASRRAPPHRAGRWAGGKPTRPDSRRIGTHWGRPPLGRRPRGVRPRQSPPARSCRWVGGSASDGSGACGPSGPLRLAAAASSLSLRCAQHSDGCIGVGS